MVTLTNRLPIELNNIDHNGNATNVISRVVIGYHNKELIFDGYEIDVYTNLTKDEFEIKLLFVDDNDILEISSCVEHLTNGNRYYWINADDCVDLIRYVNRRWDISHALKDVVENETVCENHIREYFDLKKLPPAPMVGDTYEHYKGGRYRIIPAPTNSQSGEEIEISDYSGKSIVWYQSLQTNHVWVRLLREFGELVEQNGELISRFKIVDTEKKDGADKIEND